MERVGVTAINRATSAPTLWRSGRTGASARRPRCAKPFSAVALQARYVNAWKAAIPGLEVVNMYGPTELTVIKRHSISPGRLLATMKPFRSAKPPQHADYTARQGRQVRSDGEAGEICVRGSGLASGYFGNWEKTNVSTNLTNP